MLGIEFVVVFSDCFRYCACVWHGVHCCIHRSAAEETHLCLSARCHTASLCLQVISLLHLVKCPAFSDVFHMSLYGLAVLWLVEYEYAHVDEGLE